MNEKSKQGWVKSTAKEKEASKKKIGLIGWESYSSSGVYFGILNRPAVLARYDYSDKDAVSKFSDKLPDYAQEEFRAFVSEGCLAEYLSL